jgi:aspartyl-tRNA(Asn)/glutamyl-tRNA(Gln) amidotransferase subunit C
MSLTLSEVEHIADLARLELSEEELARYREQLSAILEYAGILQQVDTRQVPPTAPALDQAPAQAASLPLRADQAAAGLNLQDVLRNAPQVENNQFRVPPVLD